MSARVWRKVGASGTCASSFCRSVQRCRLAGSPLWYFSIHGCSPGLLLHIALSLNLSGPKPLVQLPS